MNISFLMLPVFLLPTAVYSQAVDVGMLRAAGAICGAGLSLEVQGKLDVRIARILSGVEASGESTLDLGQAAELLSTFETGDRNEAYSTYVKCVTETVAAVTDVARSASPNSTAPVSVDNLLFPSPLEVVEDGQRFQMKVGESRAIISDDVIFSFDSFNSSNITFSYSLSEFVSGTTISDYGISVNKIISLTESCSVSPYKFDVVDVYDPDTVQISFQLKCR